MQLELERFDFSIPAVRAAEVAGELLKIIPSGWVSDSWGGIGEQAIFSKPGRRGGAHTAHCHVVTVPFVSTFKNEGVQEPKIRLLGRPKDISALLEFCRTICA